MPTEPVPSSLTWAVVVPVVGLLIWLVKYLVGTIKTGQDALLSEVRQLVTAVTAIPSAIKEAVKHEMQSR